MNSQVLQAPTPEEVKDLLAESKRRNACLSLYTRCAVAYEGRAQSQLESGDRFVLCKSDGTVLVHGDTNQEPRNWQPRGRQYRLPTRTHSSLQRSAPVSAR